METKLPLYQPPLPSVEFDHTTGMCNNTIHYQYLRDGRLYRSGISFKMMSASRHRAERCCKVWHIDAYDTLVVVDGSSWLEDIVADTQALWRHKWEMHHYMIYLDSAGCFEAIAESWSVVPEQEGSWPESWS